MISNSCLSKASISHKSQINGCSSLGFQFPVLQQVGHRIYTLTGRKGSANGIGFSGANVCTAGCSLSWMQWCGAAESKSAAVRELETWRNETIYLRKAAYLGAFIALRCPVKWEIKQCCRWIPSGCFRVHVCPWSSPSSWGSASFLASPSASSSPPSSLIVGKGRKLWILLAGAWQLYWAADCLLGLCACCLFTGSVLRESNRSMNRLAG